MRTLVVDGYNIMHAWPRLKRALQERGIEDARRLLVQSLAGYAAREDVSVTVVFDAHSRNAATASAEIVDGVMVRYGTRTASADHVIERLANEAARRGEAGDVVVATDDRLQRALVGAMGIATMSARALDEEVSRAAADMASEVQRARRDADSSRRIESHMTADVRRRLEMLRRGEEPDDA